jgi:putative membrane protein
MLVAWLKAFHLIAMVAWMAALFYLPRLFVYHVDAPIGSVQSETFKMMERRLLQAIATPAMLATWLFGLLLATAGGWFGAGWLSVKLLGVLLLSAFHGCCVGWVRRFASDSNQHSARFYRIANEIPTVLLIAIVLLAVLKPF